MARGLFITGFTISEVLAIQQRAKGFLIEGKTLMTWNEAGSSATKQFTIILSYWGQSFRINIFSDWSSFILIFRLIG